MSKRVCYLESPSVQTLPLTRNVCCTECLQKKQLAHQQPAHQQGEPVAGLAASRRDGKQPARTAGNLGTDVTGQSRVSQSQPRAPTSLFSTSLLSTSLLCTTFHCTSHHSTLHLTTSLLPTRSTPPRCTTGVTEECPNHPPAPPGR
jgi:hypothetical protein